MVRHLNPVRTGAGDESPGAGVLLLDKDTVAAGDRAPGPWEEGDSQLRTPHVLPKKPPGPSFIQALSGCPSIEGYSRHMVPPPSGYSAGADPPQLGGLAGGGGASSSRGTNGHRPSPTPGTQRRRPSPTTGTQRRRPSSSRVTSGCRPSPAQGNQRGPTLPRPGEPAGVVSPPGDVTAPTLLFLRNQPVPSLPHPGDPAGAHPSRGPAGGCGVASSRGTNGRRPSPA